MDIRELLAEARAAGLLLRAEGDRVHVEGPKKAEPIIAQLKERKPELLEALASDTCLDVSETSDGLARETAHSAQKASDMSKMSSGTLPSPRDPEVIDEARSMLSRNPTFGWTWEQALEGARRIIAFKRGQKAQASPSKPEVLVQMGTTGCPRCQGQEYWVTTYGKRYCVECNDGLLCYRDVVAMGRLALEVEEARRPSMRRKVGGGGAR